MKRRSLIIPALFLRLLHSRPVQHLCSAARLLFKSTHHQYNFLPGSAKKLAHFDQRNVATFRACCCLKPPGSRLAIFGLKQQLSRQSFRWCEGGLISQHPLRPLQCAARAGSIRLAEAELPCGVKMVHIRPLTSGAPGWDRNGRGDREQEKRLEVPLRIK